MAQVVINADGSLPPPSVAASDYPELVRCTLAKRRADIEALLVARDEVYKAVRTKGEIAPLDEDYDGAVVQTAAGMQVEAARLIVQIIEACHPLKEGYPLGFWTDTLISNWADALSFGVRARDLDNEEFASCLAASRPQLVATYLAAPKKSPLAKSIYGQFFTQRVCTPEFPAVINEKKVRRHLLALRSRSDA